MPWTNGTYTLRVFGPGHVLITELPFEPGSSVGQFYSHDAPLVGPVTAIIVEYTPPEES